MYMTLIQSPGGKKGNILNQYMGSLPIQHCETFCINIDMQR